MKQERPVTQLAVVITMLVLPMPGGAELGTPGTLSASQAAAQAGDELGMARELGPTTWARCAAQLSTADAAVYELSYPRSGTMPLSPFGGPFGDSTGLRTVVRMPGSSPGGPT